MQALLTIATLFGLTALFSYLNERFLKFQQTIGLMLSVLVLTLALIVLESLGLLESFAEEKAFVPRLSLDETLLNGVLCFMLFAGSNMALPLLFIELFPGWPAALLGIGILAAVMSTADGLVVSSSQIVANDLYRCIFVPRFAADTPESVIDRRVLFISRITTAAVMVICTIMALALMDRNVVMIIWIGTGGMMAAFAGPLVVGSVWKGVTKAGAFAGLLGGVSTFAITYGALIDPLWFGPGWWRNAASWLAAEAHNPLSCAAMGEIVSVALTWMVSRLTRPLPEAHLARMFGVVVDK